MNNYFPLLGGDVEVRVEATDQPTAEAAQAAAADETRRLHDMFNLYDATSPLNRWSHEHSSDLPPEVVQVLATAQDWFQRTDGAFHPVTAGLRRRWLRAEDAGAPPSTDEMATLAEGLRTLPFEVTGDTVRRTGRCDDIDLNAVAKGFIVDRAARVALELDGVTSVVIDAGGDGRHLGEGTAHVRLADGQSVPVQDEGFSTTRPGHEQFRVAGQGYSQVIDPRTGWPVEGLADLDVVAPDALTADVLATALKVLPDEAALDLVSAHAGSSFLRRREDGRRLASPGWPPG